MLERQRRAAGQANAGVIAGAGVLVDSKTLAHHALAILDALGKQRLFAPLLVEHAFGRGDDDLGAFDIGGQRFLQRIAHLRHVIGAVDLADPFRADALDGLGDGIVG